MSQIPSKVTNSSFTLLFLITLKISAIEVTGWVPYYNQDVCYQNLNTTYGSVSPGDVLTSIGLQFWRPTSGGNIEIVSDCDEYISDFVNWGASNGVKVYLTVFNNDGSWNWSLAKEAFANNKTTFVNNLISQMETHNLDGIDLDLEGFGNLDDWGGEYLNFVSALSAELKSRRKDLAIDTYWGTSYGGPNPDWWGDWIGKVDYIRPMIYNEGNDYWSLQNMGPSGIEITMGMPAWLNSWTGSAIDNLQECLNIESGVALWDLQLEGSDWRTETIWSKLKEIRDLGGSSGYALTVNSISGGNVNQNPSGSVFDEGDKVTLTAIPADGYKFLGWSGDASGTETAIIITMNSPKSITANFELDGTVEAFEMLQFGTWTAENDEFGSTVSLSHSTTEASVNYNVKSLPNDEDWTWISVSAYCEGNYNNFTSLTITYTASKDILISLYQTGPSDTGASPQYLLTASTSPKTVTIAASDFIQGDWVNPKTPLDLTKVTGIDFGPAVEPTTNIGVSGNFTITQLDIRGADLQATDKESVQRISKTLQSPIFIKNRKLNIIQNENIKEINLFTLSGKLIKNILPTDENAKNMVIDLNNVSSQSIIISLTYSTGQKRTSIYIIK